MVSEIQLFLDHLKLDQGAKPMTIDAYEGDLCQLFDFFFPKKEKNESHSSNLESLLSLDENALQSYMAELQKKEYQATTISRKLSAIRHFYQFWIREGKIETDPSFFLESPRRNQTLPKVLDPDHIAALLQQAETRFDQAKNTDPIDLQKTAIASRDRAMVTLGYASGLRVTELVSLRMPQVDIESGWLRIMGKRNKERMVPFAPIAGECLFEFFTHYRHTFQPTSDHCFVGRGGRALTRQYFWKILKALASEAKLPSHIHPHLLRHTFATDLLQSGMNLRSLQQLLGHADLQTTEIYTHVAPETLKEVIRKFHPRGSK